MGMPTIRDVAREAGVSVASASRALNDRANVTPATRAKVMASVLKLNFVPHSGARSLTRRKTDTIGVILPDLFGEFFSEIVRGIDLVAHESGLHLLFGNMHGSAHETASAIRAMRGRVDGLLLMPPEVKPDMLSAHLDPAIPTVLINYDGKPLDLPFVAIDNYRAAYQMTEFLLGEGFRQIAHIAGAKHNRDARERQRGFLEAMKTLADQPNPAILPGDFTETGGREAGRLLVAGKVPADAVFAANDMMAVGCMTMLAENGIVAPGDIAISGFDDIPLARHIVPALTTMQVHMVELGSTAMMLLLRMLRGETLTADAGQVLTPALMVRSSSGGAGAKIEGPDRPAGLSVA